VNLSTSMRTFAAGFAAVGPGFLALGGIVAIGG